MCNLCFTIKLTQRSTEFMTAIQIKGNNREEKYISLKRLYGIKNVFLGRIKTYCDEYKFVL